MRIIDAHHHFWDLDANYLPWLSDRPVAFRYGDYDAIRRNYLADDFRRDSAEFELAGSVFVETEWDPTDPLGEVRWVAGQRAREGLPSVMVAQAWLDRGDAEEVLEAHGATDFVHGIRHKPRAAPAPDAATPGAPGSMGDPAWRAGYAMLAPNGLSFDLQTPWWHLAEARALADDFPDTALILNHTGLPSDRSEEGLAGWQAAMRTLAGAGNTVVKISGLGLPGRPWSAEDNRRVVQDTIDTFGVDRCMFASNFPVDSLVGGYDTIMGGFSRIVEDFPEAERRALFHDNAARVYRVAPG